MATIAVTVALPAAAALAVTVTLFAAAAAGESLHARPEAAPSRDRRDPNVPPGQQPAPEGAQPAGPAFLAVVGGTLIDGTGADPIPDSAVIVEGDRIRAAGARRRVRIPPGSVAVDATDLTVIPGLIDMHVHLLEGVDLRAFLAHGVTSVRHLGDTTLEWITGIKRRVEGGEEPGPRIFHCGMFVVSEPPLRREVYPPEGLARFFIMKSPADAPAVVQRLLEAGADVVKVKTEMSPENLKALCAAAAAAGLPVTVDSGGETGSYDALSALRAGARGVEHLSGIPFDDPKAVEAVLEEMIATRAFAVPTLVAVARTYSARRVAAREAFVRRLAESGGMVVAGTDVPTGAIAPGAGLHQEMERLVALGLTPRQALSAATGNAARALGYQGIVGTIEAGAYADLVLVAGDPLRSIADADRIIRVFKGGREYFRGEATAPREEPAQSP